MNETQTKNPPVWSRAADGGLEDGGLHDRRRAVAPQFAKGSTGGRLPENAGGKPRGKRDTKRKPPISALPSLALNAKRRNRSQNPRYPRLMGKPACFRRELVLESRCLLIRGLTHRQSAQAHNRDLDGFYTNKHAKHCAQRRGSVHSERTARGQRAQASRRISSWHSCPPFL